MLVVKYLPFVAFFILISLGCLIAFEKKPTIKNAIIYGSLAIYLVCIAWLLFTPGQYFFDPYVYNNDYYYWHHAKIILYPENLRSIGSYMNVIMTIPAGIYFGLLFNRHLNIIFMVFVAGLTGMFNEGTQLILDALFNIQRTVDITDVITNAIGVLIGYIFFALFIRPFMKK